jgi:hypothetical protein
VAVEYVQGERAVDRAGHVAGDRVQRLDVAAEALARARRPASPARASGVR